MVVRLMGHAYEYRCSRCRKKELIHFGCGMGAKVFHCDSCGKENFVPLIELWKNSSRISKTTNDKNSNLNFDPLINPESLKKDVKSLDAYLSVIEDLIGRCSCGGRWSPIAQPSCPSCGIMIPLETFNTDPKICWD